MSAWTNFRDSLEDEIEPEIAKGIAFLHAIETLTESEALGDAEKAAEAGVAAAEATVGTIEAKAVAALEAFGSALLGYTIAIVKNAASTPPSTPVV